MSEKHKIPALELQPKAITDYKVTITAPCDDPYFENGKYLGEMHTLDMEMKIHPNNSGKIMIIVPGLGGSIDGYENKYANIATRSQESNLAAVVRIHGPKYTGYLPDLEVRLALALSLQNSQVICGNPNPDVYLMGYSAGAGGVAAIAHEFPQVKRILLVAPGYNMPKKDVKRGLAKFNGEVYVVQGQNDEMVGSKTGPECYEFAHNSSRRELIMVPNCSHQFVGQKNGEILAQSPFYAFSPYTDRVPFLQPTLADDKSTRESAIKRIIRRII